MLATSMGKKYSHNQAVFMAVGLPVILLGRLRESQELGGGKLELLLAVSSGLSALSFLKAFVTKPLRINFFLVTLAVAIKGREQKNREQGIFLEIQLQCVINYLITQMRYLPTRLPTGNTLQ
jgi:hypothetical protein